MLTQQQNQDRQQQQQQISITSPSPPVVPVPPPPSDTLIIIVVIVIVIHPVIVHPAAPLEVAVPGPAAPVRPELAAVGVDAGLLALVRGASGQAAAVPHVVPVKVRVDVGALGEQGRGSVGYRAQGENPGGHARAGAGAEEWVAHARGVTGLDWNEEMSVRLQRVLMGRIKINLTEIPVLLDLWKMSF